MHQSFETSGPTGTEIAGLSYFQMQSPGKHPALRGQFYDKIPAKSPRLRGNEINKVQQMN